MTLETLTRTLDSAMYAVMTTLASETDQTVDAALHAPVSAAALFDDLCACMGLESPVFVREALGEGDV